MLNSSSNGKNDLDDQNYKLAKPLKEAMVKLLADHVLLKEKLKKVTEERTKYKLLWGDLENKFVVKEDDDMETLKRKKITCKAEAKKANVMLKKKAKAGATRSTAENVKAYTEKQNDGAKVEHVIVDEMCLESDLYDAGANTVFTDAQVKKAKSYRKRVTAVNPAQLPKPNKKRSADGASRPAKKLKARYTLPNMNDLVHVHDMVQREFVVLNVKTSDGVFITLMDVDNNKVLRVPVQKIKEVVKPATTPKGKRSKFAALKQYCEEIQLTAEAEDCSTYEELYQMVLDCPAICNDETELEKTIEYYMEKDAKKL